MNAYGGDDDEPGPVTLGSTVSRTAETLPPTRRQPARDRVRTRPSPQDAQARVKARKTGYASVLLALCGGFVLGLLVMWLLGFIAH